MTKLERRLFTLTNLIISIIGIIYFIMDFFFKVDTDFGQRPHAFTATLLYLHIITVPILIFFVGSLFKSHIFPKIKSGVKTRRYSGISLFVLFLLMSMTGYLLQTAISGGEIMGNAHLIFSFLWIIGYLWHFRLRI